MTDTLFTWIFVGALVASTSLRLWLARRQIRHVRAHRGAVPRDFLNAIPLDAHQKAADYTIAKSRVGEVDLLIQAGGLLVLTLGGLLEWISEQWARLFAPTGLAHGVALVVSVTLLVTALDLPASLYRTFVIEERFGFNRMTWRLFVADLARQGLVGALLGVPLVVLVLWLMAVMGGLWWLYVWLAWTGFNLLMLLVYPTLIQPLFNKFTRLEDAELGKRVDALLARCGFRAKGLYVMDGSKRSNHSNAYFTGFGAAKRVVFFDTLLARLAPPEIEAVLAHELGHFKRRHVWKLTVLLFFFSALLLWTLGQLIDQPWFYAGLGVRTHSNAVALLLFVLVSPVFTFFLQPIASLYSRKHEYEADAYAAEYSSKGSLVKALVKLYHDNASTLTPDPLYSAFYDSHPPAASRVARLQGAAST